ncbi:MAG TPA: hypothetical protein VG347_01525 [Verrucomicrobiae bacterium]|nr:hypothetical protein [Verrucomicrobiae bacterium]
MTTADSLARGTPAYTATATQYGTAAADAQWQAAITAEKNGTPLDDSFFSNLGSQLYNDPLGAPADQLAKVINNTATDANNVGSSAFLSVLKNPFVLLALLAVGFGVFIYFGGWALLKRKKSA